jgi:cytochrome c553
MRPLLSTLWLLSLAWLSSCTYDNAEDLAAEEPEPTPTCDVRSVTYTASISPILAQSCRGCHNAGSPAGGINLVDYAQVKRYADNGRLIGSISHAAGYRAMPLNGAKLSDCDIARFQAWINAGAPNN